MGYTTDFSGQFNVSPALKPEHAAYLAAFAETRRIKRNIHSPILDNDPKRLAVGLGLGKEGGYFVNAEGFAGQSKDASVLEYNSPPSGQPGLWCQWVPNEQGTAIVHDGGEKFYDYIEWIQYLIEHFLQPWGYMVNGIVKWSGEEQGDIGMIIVDDNEVTTKEGHIVYEEPEEETDRDVYADIASALNTNYGSWEPLGREAKIAQIMEIIKYQLEHQ